MDKYELSGAVTDLMCQFVGGIGRVSQCRAYAIRKETKEHDRPGECVWAGRYKTSSKLPHGP
jgi:hypothetical protein